MQHTFFFPDETMRIIITYLQDLKMASESIKRDLLTTQSEYANEFEQMGEISIPEIYTLELYSVEFLHSSGT